MCEFGVGWGPGRLKKGQGSRGTPDDKDLLHSVGREGLGRSL